jgi:hypothetical protein
LFSVPTRTLIGLAALFGVIALCCGLCAQNGNDVPNRESTRPVPVDGRALVKKAARRSATIHWQRVPLHDAIGRLRALFDETVFVDRRVDPGMRVTLDIESASAEDVVAAIASGKDLGVSRLGSLVYLGPATAANQLRAVSAARSNDAARLSAEVRATITKKQPTTWHRLSEPRGLIKSAIEHRGWQLANAEAIPHDLWSAGELPDLSMAEQLTVLLIGFDLTFEVRPNERSIVIVPLRLITKSASPSTSRKPPAPLANTPRSEQGGRHEYTLRVQEKSVGAVLQALAKRLNWSIQIDEDSIRKAGKSLDTHISFSVENADQEHLLEALCRPAGLDFRIKGEQVWIVAGRYDEK